MGSTFEPNYEGIGRMLKSDGMQAAMMRLAGKVEERAVATAPYDPTSAEHFKDHFHVIARPRHDRAAAVVYNDDEAALSIEFGTGEAHSRTPAHHTLHRAIDALGE